MRKDEKEKERRRGRLVEIFFRDFFLFSSVFSQFRLGESQRSWKELRNFYCFEESTYITRCVMNYINIVMTYLMDNR